MSRATYTPNPGFAAEMGRDAELRTALHEAGQDIAAEAEQRGTSVAPSYHATVADEGGGVRVEADTRELTAASWIEWGAQHLPPSAPLRTGITAAGYRLGD